MFVLVHYSALCSDSTFLHPCASISFADFSNYVPYACACAFHPIADDDGEPESVHAHLHRGADARASRHAHSLLLQHVLLTADAQSAPRLAADLLRGRSLPVKDVKRALTRPLALPEPTTAAVASGHAEAQRHMVAGAALPRLPRLPQDGAGTGPRGRMGQKESKTWSSHWFVALKIVGRVSATFFLLF